VKAWHSLRCAAVLLLLVTFCSQSDRAKLVLFFGGNLMKHRVVGAALTCPLVTFLACGVWAVC
jgi:hypothetical protein